MITPQRFRVQSLALDEDDLPPIETQADTRQPEFETSIHPIPVDAGNAQDEPGPGTQRLARNQLQRMVTAVIDQLLRRRGLPLPSEQREHLIHQARSILDAALKPDEAQDIGIRRFRRLIDAMRDELDVLHQQMSANEERDAVAEAEERASLQAQLAQAQAEVKRERTARVQLQRQAKQLKAQVIEQQRDLHDSAASVLEDFDSFLGSDMRSQLEVSNDTMRQLQDACAEMMRFASDMRSERMMLRREYTRLKERYLKLRDAVRAAKARAAAATGRTA